MCSNSSGSVPVTVVWDHGHDINADSVVACIRNIKSNASVVTKLDKSENELYFEKTIGLKQAKYELRFIVNGCWTLDLDLKHEGNDQGHFSNILEVRDDISECWSKSPHLQNIREGFKSYQRRLAETLKHLKKGAPTDFEKESELPELEEIVASNKSSPALDDEYSDQDNFAPPDDQEWLEELESLDEEVILAGQDFNYDYPRSSPGEREDKRNEEKSQFVSEGKEKVEEDANIETTDNDPGHDFQDEKQTLELADANCTEVDLTETFEDLISQDQRDKMEEFNLKIEETTAENADPVCVDKASISEKRNSQGSSEVNAEVSETFKTVEDKLVDQVDLMQFELNDEGSEEEKVMNTQTKDVQKISRMKEDSKDNISIDEIFSNKDILSEPDLTINEILKEKIENPESRDTILSVTSKDHDLTKSLESRDPAGSLENESHIPTLSTTLIKESNEAPHEKQSDAHDGKEVLGDELSEGRRAIEENQMNDPKSINIENWDTRNKDTVKSQDIVNSKLSSMFQGKEYECLTMGKDTLDPSQVDSDTEVFELVTNCKDPEVVLLCFSLAHNLIQSALDECFKRFAKDEVEVDEIKVFEKVNEIDTLKKEDIMENDQPNVYRNENTKEDELGNHIDSLTLSDLPDLEIPNSEHPQQKAKLAGKFKRRKKKHKVRDHHESILDELVHWPGFKNFTEELLHDVAKKKESKTRLKTPLLPLRFNQEILLSEVKRFPVFESKIEMESEMDIFKEVRKELTFIQRYQSKADLSLKDQQTSSERDKSKPEVVRTTREINPKTIENNQLCNLGHQTPQGTKRDEDKDDNEEDFSHVVVKVPTKKNYGQNTKLDQVFGQFRDLELPGFSSTSRTNSKF